MPWDSTSVKNIMIEIIQHEQYARDTKKLLFTLTISLNPIEAKTIYI
jgi:hypothetical protein